MSEARPDDWTRIRGAGFDACLSKPPDLGELEALLRETIRI